MITIDWSCGFGAGYGDIVSPLCYAQNISDIKDNMVTLVMNWRFLKSQSTESSPDAKIDYLVKRFDFTSVQVKHNYNTRHDDNINLNEKLKNIKHLDPMHNVYFPVPRSSITPKYNVVCSTINNIDQFNVYAGGKRMWKDALTNEQWKHLIDQPDTVHVDYRTPLHEVVDILYQCKFFIGYHGSCAWLARMMGLPIKIYTKDKWLTEYCFPWSLDQNEPVNPDKAQMKVEHYRMVRDEYIDNLRRTRS